MISNNDPLLKDTNSVISSPIGEREAIAQS